jgi:hypothetical protein
MLLSNKTIYNSILFLLFLIVSLWMIRYIRSEEGFANPSTEVYELQKVFKPYPLEKICPIYDSVYAGILKGEKTGPDGGPVPDDVAAMNAKKKIGEYVITGIFPCPFSFAKSSELGEVFKYVENMDPMILGKAYNTLLYCRASLDYAVQKGQEAVSKIPKNLPTEGFITECSAVELQNQNIIPLQCVPPESMKASEQADILAEDKMIQIHKVYQKKEITLKLKQVLENFEGFRKSFQRNMAGELAAVEKALAETQRGVDLAKELFEKDKGNATYQRMLEDGGRQVEAQKMRRDLLSRFVKFQNESFDKMIEECGKSQAEVNRIQRALESGDFSSL